MAFVTWHRQPTFPGPRVVVLWPTLGVLFSICHINFKLSLFPSVTSALYRFMRHAPPDERDEKGLPPPHEERAAFCCSQTLRSASHDRPEPPPRPPWPPRSASSRPRRTRRGRARRGLGGGPMGGSSRRGGASNSERRLDQFFYL